MNVDDYLTERRHSKPMLAVVQALGYAVTAMLYNKHGNKALVAEVARRSLHRKMARPAGGSWSMIEQRIRELRADNQIYFWGQNRTSSLLAQPIRPRTW